MSLQQTNARPISNKQQLDLSTKEDHIPKTSSNISTGSISSHPQNMISGETVKLEVSADQAKWHTRWELQVSKYPNAKSGYESIILTSRYTEARAELKKSMVQKSTANGWKYRLKKFTFAEISVTTLVKTEILKP